MVASAKKIEEVLGEGIALPGELPLNYNVAPTQSGLVLTDADPHQLKLFRWGLVPFWAQDLSIGSRMINARGETILEKPAFRQAIRRRRCLVLADSFYEWRREGKHKTPLRIMRPDEELLLMAGIWERWQGDDRSEPVHTYSIITAAPNAEMSPVHNRMPVFFPNTDQQSAWLDPSLSDAHITELLQTPADGTLKWYPVSSLVNKVRNNGPELHEPSEGS